MIVNESSAEHATLLAARHALIQERTSAGHWEGRLSSSALSTATAVVAFALFLRERPGESSGDGDLVQRGIGWLLDHQNEDGGWGDTDRSLSNISTTALGWAALAFAAEHEVVAAAERRAEAWLTHAAGGGAPSTLARSIVARYGKDKTFSVPILTMCALAGRLGPERKAWALIPQLPFELAVIPRKFFTVMTLPVVSYAFPALIAMGLIRHRRRPSRNPVARSIRDAAVSRSLGVLDALQPANGGFLEAAPLTSFVAMSIIAAGHATHPVAQRAIDFLRQSVRDDGSWPIDTNLATWVTTMSVQALNARGHLTRHLDESARTSVRDWLLAQQTRDEHPYTGAAPGGWSWTNLPGGVPDADDTPGALLALRDLDPDDETRQAAARGVRWLLDLQNRDGGIPTFCRGWGALPFDRSGADLTAHAVRAWLAWRPDLEPLLRARVDRALDRAIGYLARVQRADGAFVPLWFGNQHVSGEANPTYGTSRVLLALRAARGQTPRNADAVVSRAIHWLATAQNPDGGWGGDAGAPSSIEETALATGGLAACADDDGASRAAGRGASWLARATRHGTWFPSSPIGLYFAKLWYYERLYPIVLVAEALERLGPSEGAS
jgi:squalene-hopene/tetraprenyl-beta-curcumene cyclase